MAVRSNDFSIFFPQDVPFRDPVYVTSTLSSQSAYSYPTFDTQYPPDPIFYGFWNNDPRALGLVSSPFLFRVSGAPIGITSMQTKTPVWFYTKN